MSTSDQFLTSFWQSEQAKASQQKVQDLRNSVSYATTQNPDKYANLRLLHKQTGVPPQVAQGQESDVQQAATMGSFDFDSYVARAPKLSVWASNPDNAAVSVDDLHNLASIEANAQTIGNLTASQRAAVVEERKRLYLHNKDRNEAMSAVASTESGFYSPFINFGANAVSLLDHLSATVRYGTDIATGMLPAEGGLDVIKKTWAGQNPTPSGTSGQALGAAEKANQYIAGPQKAGPQQFLVDSSTGQKFENPDYRWWGRPLVNTVQSVPGAIGGFMVGGEVAGPQAMPTVMATNATAERYRQALNEGADLPTAMAEGAGSGLLNYALMTKVPAPVQADTIKGAVAQTLARGATLGLGMTVGENALARLHDPNRPLFEGAGPNIASMVAFESAGALGNIIEIANQSKLKARSPEAFRESMQAIFQGDPSLRIPVDQFTEYFHGKDMSAQRVAEELGATNYPEALLSGGEVEVPAAEFISKLDIEHQRALFPDIVLPATGNTIRQTQEQAAERQKFIAEGGPEKLQQEAAKADAETAATPEYSAVKEELRQRYTDAGETPQVADDLATKDANVYANLAKQVGMKPDELLKLYNPQVKAAEAPGVEGQLNQASIPHIAYDESGNITDADGRHRVIAALERGDKSIAIETKMRDGGVQTLHVDPQLVARKLGVTPESLRATDAQQAQYFRTLYQDAVDGNQPRGWFRVMPDGSFEIGKTSIGDLSTFVHEPAHGYLQLIGDLAKREGASDTLKGDYAKILDFIGAKDGEALTTEQHETWARANEQYLREGKAPSEGLKGVFQRFAIWLSGVYKNARDLGVTLTDDIRGVFDRLYAAEEGVNRAESEVGPRLFQSAEEAGWTDEQFQKYAADNGMAVDQAKAEILSKLNESALREKTESWIREEFNVRQAMTEEVNRKPEYIAMRALRKGKMEDGTAVGLNRDELVKQFGEERVKELQKKHPGMYRNEGGMDVDTVAEMLGFDSGDRMLKALEASPRRSAAITEATKAYMTAKHGDIRFDGTLDDQARLAVANEKRAANLHSELKALRKKVAELKTKAADQKAAARGIEIAPLDAYREAAQQMVESKSIADLQPHRYLDASRKYSREAFDAVRSGDVEKAADAKHKELMNHFLFREATKARDVADKIETYATKMSQVKELRKLGLAGQPYLEQIQTLLGRYGFDRGRSLLDPGQARNETLDQFVTRLKTDEGLDLPIDPAILDESGPNRNYRSLPFSELKSVYEAMRMIDHAAKVVNSVRGEQQRLAIAHAAVSLNQRLEESVGKPEVRKASDRARSFMERVKDVNLDIAVQLPEFMFERFDGLSKQGPWHDYFWNRYNDAADHLNRLREMVFPKIMEYRETKVDRSKKFYIESIDRTLTKDDILSIALNSGNESNLEKQMRGGIQFEKDEAPTQLSHQALQEILSHLSPDEIKMVNGIWQTIGLLKPEAAALERKRTGVEPTWIEPKSLDIANGTLEGGYYPLKYDPRFSAAGEKQADASTVQQMFAKYASATTRQGYLKGRTQFFAPLTLDWQATVSRHLDEAAIDISHWEFASDSQRLLKNAEVKSSIVRNMGNAYYKNLLDWVRYTVNQDSMGREASDNIDRFRRTMRNNVSTAVLGFRVGNAVAEAAITPLLAVQHVSPESAFKGMMTFMRNPVESAKFASEASDYMKRIDKEVDRDVTVALNDLAGKNSLLDDIKRWSIASRMYFWKMGAVMSWHAGYTDAMKRGLEGDEAVRVADSIYRMTQESGRPGDLSAVQRNPYMKELTQFIGPSLIQYNNYRRTLNAFKDQGFTSKTAAIGMSTLFAAFANNVVFNLMRGKGPKDGEWPAWLLARMTFGMVDGLPILRDASGYAEGKLLGEHGKDFRLSPALQVGKDTVDAALATAHAVQGTTTPTKAVKQGARAVGGLTGLPATQGAITGQYVYDVLTGQYKPAHPWSPITDAAYARPSH